MKPLDHLPEIGERILVDPAGAGKAELMIPAVIIGMAECQVLVANLWQDRKGNWMGPKEKPFYEPDDTIRAYKFDHAVAGKLASFCIMRFGVPGRYSYNSYIYLPEDT